MPILTVQVLRMPPVAAAAGTQSLDQAPPTRGAREPMAARSPRKPKMAGHQRPIRRPPFDPPSVQHALRVDLAQAVVDVVAAELGVLQEAAAAARGRPRPSQRLYGK